MFSQTYLSAGRCGLSLFKWMKQSINAFTIWYWCTIEYIYSQKTSWNECHILWNINAYWKLIFRPAIYLEYNQQKCIKFPRRFVKELFDFLFWRPEDNSHCMVNRQMNFAHAHFKNSWSGYPIWIFVNLVKINPFEWFL